MKLNKLWPICSIVILLINLAIYDSVKAECRKANKSFFEYSSTTCWDYAYEHIIKHGFIEISQNSASSVRRALNEFDSDILMEFANVERALTQCRPKSVGFVVSHQNVEQNDCGLYAVSPLGKLEKEKLLHTFGTSWGGKRECREIMRRIGRGVPQSVDEKTRKAATVGVPGFDRVFWSNHPNARISNEFENSTINVLWMYDIIHPPVSG